MPILIVAYQFFFNFSFIVLGEEIYGNILNGHTFGEKWFSIILLIAIVCGIAFGFIMLLRLIAKKINGYNPAITRKEYILDHLFGAVVILYLILATFVPGFPYIFGSAIKQEIFISKKLFIFAMVPLIAEFISALLIPYCRNCGFIGERTHIEIASRHEDSESYTSYEVVGREKVGETITTTTYYDEDGNYDHEDVETEDKYEDVYGYRNHGSYTRVATEECDYCGHKEEKYEHHSY